MNPQTFIFFGPSGCGKGTQAKLLVEQLKKNDSENDVIYIETGQKFREFQKGTSLTSQYVKEILDQGGLIPEFMPIWIWTQVFVENIKTGREHMILDGLSRRADEAPILNSAMQFYKRENPFVISIELSDEVAAERLRNRGRADDNNLDIAARLKWYKDNVVPAINYLRNNPYYKFIAVDGNRPIEEVHKEILEKTIVD